MAVDTAVTAKTGFTPVGLENSLFVLTRTIDFSLHNLASGAWFELFTIPTGAMIVAGFYEILTLDAGGGTIALGTGGSNQLLTAAATSAVTKVKITNTDVILSATAAVAVTIAAGTAALTTAKVRVKLLCLHGQVDISTE